MLPRLVPAALSWNPFFFRTRKPTFSMQLLTATCLLA